MRDERLPMCSVRYATACGWMTALTLALIALSTTSALRLGQRALWLFRDFRPSGDWREGVFLLLHEGWLAASALLRVLLGIGALGLRLQRKSAGRLLYRVESWESRLNGLLALLLAALAGGLIALAVRYRLSITVIGVLSLVGLASVIGLLVARQFHKNMAKVLADVNHSLPRGQFQRGGGVRRHVQSQASLLTLISLVPTLVVVLEGAAGLWLFQTIAQLFGAAAAGEVKRLLWGGATSVVAMYGVEAAQQVLTAAAYALSVPLYGRYMRAHDEKPPKRLFRSKAANGAAPSA